MIKKVTRLLALAVLAAAMSYVFPAGAAAPGTSGFNRSNIIAVKCLEENEDEDGTQYRTAGWIVFQGETLLWPPNHKYRNASVRATDEDNFHPDDDANGASDGNTSSDALNSDQMDLTLVISDSNTRDGYTNGAGKPTVANVLLPAASAGDTGGTDNSSGDSDGSATVPFQVQSERSGRDQAGRIYKIEATAHFTDTDDNFGRDDDGSSNDRTTCETTFQICVPHDMRASYRAKSDADKCANPIHGSQITESA